MKWFTDLAVLVYVDFMFYLNWSAIRLLVLSAGRVRIFFKYDLSTRKSSHSFPVLTGLEASMFHRIFMSATRTILKGFHVRLNRTVDDWDSQTACTRLAPWCQSLSPSRSWEYCEVRWSWVRDCLCSSSAWGIRPCASQIYPYVTKKLRVLGGYQLVETQVHHKAFLRSGSSYLGNQLLY